MHLGFVHLHRRARTEPYPSPAPAKRFLDYLMYAVAIGAPLALIPQVYTIYESKEVHGLAPSTWALLAGFNGLWIVYGFTHKTPPIVVSNVVFFLLHAATLWGIFLYR